MTLVWNNVNCLVRAKIKRVNHSLDLKIYPYGQCKIFIRDVIKLYVLNSIKIENFGCFDEECSIKFKKLNVIVGSNNSGKSTIFKALNLFRISDLQINHKPFWLSDYYSLVDFNSTAYDKSKKFTVTVNKDDNFKTLSILNNKMEYDGIQLANLKPTSNMIRDDITYINSSRKFIDHQNSTGASYHIATKSDMFNLQIQDICSDGRNMIQFLVEKWTSQDSNMKSFEEWLHKIDPKIESFKTPIVSSSSSLSTKRTDGKNSKAINMHFQGNGIQNAIIIIAAVVFSPKNSTIIIEEPELYQHSRNMEILVDLFNYAVNKLDKQIIIVTHSFEIINAYCSDIGQGTDRGNNHVKANTSDFKLIVVNDIVGSEKIIEYDLTDKKYSDVRKDFKILLG